MFDSAIRSHICFDWTVPVTRHDVSNLPDHHSFMLWKYIRSVQSGNRLLKESVIHPLVIYSTGRSIIHPSFCLPAVFTVAIQLRTDDDAVSTLGDDDPSARGGRHAVCRWRVCCRWRVHAGCRRQPRWWPRQASTTFSTTEGWLFALGRTPGKRSRGGRRTDQLRELIRLTDGRLRTRSWVVTVHTSQHGNDVMTVVQRTLVQFDRLFAVYFNWLRQIKNGANGRMNRL